MKIHTKLLVLQSKYTKLLDVDSPSLFTKKPFEEELRIRNIPYQREKSFSFTYKGKKLNKEFRPDFVCFEKIIVELKAVSDLADEHFAQVYNYLKATDMKLGILINFGKESLEYKRIPCSKKW